MATIPSSVFRQIRGMAGVTIVQWTLPSSGDVGIEYPVARYPRRSVQVYGASGTVQMQGSNIPAPTTPTHFNLLLGTQGNTLSLVVPDHSKIEEDVAWLRPALVSGSAILVSVVLTTDSAG